MTSATERSISAVVFDLGGVLVDLGDVQQLIGLFGQPLPEAEARARWSSSPAVHAHESGAIDANQFAEAFVNEQSVPLSPAAFLERFVAWPKGAFAGAADLVDAVAQQLPTYLLSNTSAIHWQRITSEFDLVHRFHQLFLSFEMGLMKPGTDIFQAMLDQLALPAQNVLFLDDSTFNVEGARQAQLNAQRVVGVKAARDCLISQGVLSS